MNIYYLLDPKQVMIEAVENHMPQTIIIDEIGTELEAMAASTIAQRGVQLVATAHGITVESIMKNPALQILIGGIEVQTDTLAFHFHLFACYTMDISIMLKNCNKLSHLHFLSYGSIRLAVLKFLRSESSILKLVKHIW